MRYPDRVVRRRAALVAGPYNRQVRDWPNASTLVLSANVQPGASSEDVVRQQRTETFARFFLPLGSDVVPTDRVEWRGDTYEVDGDVQVRARGDRGHVLFVGAKVTQS